MKKLIITISLFIFFAGSIALTGFQSNAQKEQAAKQKVEQAQKDADAAQLKTTTDLEWKAFKAESLLKINENENNIASLRVQLNKPGKVLDPLYEARIKALEKQNADLKMRIADYNGNPSEWEAFKKEANHDFEELGKAIKDFTIDNK